MIRLAIRRFGIDLSEAEHSDPAAYPSFDAFFTRALKTGARQPDPDPDAILAPADGRIVSVGPVHRGSLLQAKGQHYPLSELLADEALALRFEGGQQLTIYLSPRDYHRVHMPGRGASCEDALHLPGRLFSRSTERAPIPSRGCSSATSVIASSSKARSVPSRSYLVAALLVGGIETVFAGRIIPPRPRRILDLAPAEAAQAAARFAELGRFHHWL